MRLAFRNIMRRYGGDVAYTACASVRVSIAQEFFEGSACAVVRMTIARMSSMWLALVRQRCEGVYHSAF
jgi:hypothetical protein